MRATRSAAAARTPNLSPSPLLPRLGTLGSNWNRLIDELRCVWVPKCMQPYIELGKAAPGMASAEESY